ncbi:DUF2141 domain-containing protein [Marinomonas balearica]|uniref:Uncharacterized protein (DUF2141 family) n=1 Tax=Marinomonas balearica TaxID=491947 RepID=A0A4V3CGY5_9GAMM|nr:DUF2141 domain-containing protein [Marinomonas balearica]TDO99542.1 uncharacterized protein (DUF2141 family) [Marinomonas balearica]
MTTLFYKAFSAITSSLLKLIFSLIVLYCTSSLASEKSAGLQLTFTGLVPNSGYIMGSFYHLEEDFKTGKNGFSQIREPVLSDTLAITVSDLPDAPIIFVSYQDLNDNQALDTNLFGVPTEPYAFSNNAKGRFGPPKFSDMLFTPSMTNEMTIHYSHTSD